MGRLWVETTLGRNVGTSECLDDISLKSEGNEMEKIVGILAWVPTNFKKCPLIIYSKLNKLQIKLLWVFINSNKVLGSMKNKKILNLSDPLISGKTNKSLLYCCTMDYQIALVDAYNLFLWPEASKPSFICCALWSQEYHFGRGPWAQQTIAVFV